MNIIKLNNLTTTIKSLLTESIIKDINISIDQEYTTHITTLKLSVEWFIRHSPTPEVNWDVILLASEKILSHYSFSRYHVNQIISEIIDPLYSLNIIKCKKSNHDIFIKSIEEIFEKKHKDLSNLRENFDKKISIYQDLLTRLRSNFLSPQIEEQASMVDKMLAIAEDKAKDVFVKLDEIITHIDTCTAALNQEEKNNLLLHSSSPSSGFF